MSYELTRWIYSAAELESRLQESGGEISPELEQWMAMIDLKLPASVDNAKLLFDRMETIEKEYRERAAACAKVARGVSTMLDRMKSNVKAISVATKTKEFLGAAYRLVVSPAKARLEIDESLLPVEWKTIQVTYVPDKEKIRAALAAGQQIPGTALQDAYSLRSYFRKE